MPVRILSDVNRLRKVLLHKPGRELLNLIPSYLHQQLFDDIPWYERAVEEHNSFAKILTARGVEVFYVKDMLCECIAQGGKRGELTDRFLAEAFGGHDADTANGGFRESGNKNVSKYLGAARGYLEGLDDAALIEAMIGGLRKDELGVKDGGYPFILDPMPNMMFTRDPFSFIGGGVSLSRMFMPARARESLFGDFLLANHTEFAGVKRYYERSDPYSIEGGDIMVLASHAVAVGVSERTSESAVRKLADKLLRDFSRVLAVRVPNERRFMHLDTVMTMVDRKKFVVYREAIENSSAVLYESKGGTSERGLAIGACGCEAVAGMSERELSMPLKDALRETMDADKIDFIYCGGKDETDAAREQWNDGANTLAIAPGEVVVYNRNPVTNKLLTDSGVIIHEMPCSELSRGRGGPHCMSMAFLRDAE